MKMMMMIIIIIIIIIIIFISTVPSPESVQGALQSVHCYLKL